MKEGKENSHEVENPDWIAEHRFAYGSCPIFILPLLIQVQRKHAHFSYSRFLFSLSLLFSLLFQQKIVICSRGVGVISLYSSHLLCGIQGFDEGM